MKNATTKVSSSALVAIGLMLFALFFGAGNLIFPAGLGRLAGENLTPAMLGFIVTGVGLPLLGVLAIGYSGCKDVQELGARFHPAYGVIFAVLLYLTIGPFFAMPRTATVSFVVGIEPFLAAGDHSIQLMLFSIAFFVVCWWLSLNPGKLVDRIGKVLTPLLLISIGILVVATIANPMGVPQPAKDAYVNEPFVKGFLEGYQTMDALASLVFAIIVINAVRAMGITDKKAITMSTLKAGLVASFFLALVYIFVAKMGVNTVETVNIEGDSGARVLSTTAEFYFGKVGNGLLAVIILLACITTSVGLITACAEYFHRLLPKISFKAFATGLAIFAAIIANKGLDQIISLAVPVLMFLYPLTVVLIALAFLNNLFKGRQAVYVSTLSLTLIVSFFDGLNAAGCLSDSFKQTLADVLPGYALGMGWLAPAIIGFVIGFIWTKLAPKS